MDESSLNKFGDEWLMTRREAAQYLDIKVNTLARWSSEGKYRIPEVVVGTNIRYRKRDLDAWIALRTRNRIKAAW